MIAAQRDPRREVRNGSESERDEVRKLRKPHHDYRLDNLLVTESICAQSIDVVPAHLSGAVVQLARKVKQRLQREWEIRCGMIHGDLLRLRTVDAQHPYDLTVRRH